jgi:hypothetical protein
MCDSTIANLGFHEVHSREGLFVLHIAQDHHTCNLHNFQIMMAFEPKWVHNLVVGLQSIGGCKVA